jgi:hypothetical protein
MLIRFRLLTGVTGPAEGRADMFRGWRTCSWAAGVPVPRSGSGGCGAAGPAADPGTGGGRSSTGAAWRTPDPGQWTGSARGRLLFAALRKPA